MHLLRTFGAIGFALATAGCDGALERGPSFDTNVLMPVLYDTSPGTNGDYSTTTDGSTGTEVIIPADCRFKSGSSTDKAQKFMLDPTQETRNECMWTLIRIIDDKYARYEASLRSLATNTGAFTDLAVLGLSGAGTAVAGAATKTVLAAISGGLTGAKSALDRDYLYSQSIYIVTNQMDADRSAQLTAMLTRAAADTDTVTESSPKPKKYSISQMKDDLLQYYAAGTFGNALKSLATSTASNANACQAQATAAKTNAPTGGAGNGGGNPGTSATESGTQCNTVSPAG